MENIKMTEWREVKLSDLISIKHGYAFKGEFFSEEETPYILVTPGNFNIGGSFKSDKFKWYKGEIPTDYILKKDDLIVTMTDLSKNGDTLGYSALVPELNRKVLLHNQRIGLVEIKSQKIDKFFLYWLMRTSVYQKSIVNTASGSTVKHTSPDRVCQFSFLLPPLDIQRKIAGILGALDDRIDVLRRENVVLEQMAQAVFQSWFVDFDIVRAKAAGTPESEVCEKYHISPELYALFPSALTPDNLPLGWEKKKLGDFLILSYGKALKENDRVSGSVPVYGSSGQIGTHNESLVKAPGIVVGRKGTVGSVIWCDYDFYPIDTVFYVQFLKEGVCWYFAYFLLKILKLQNLAGDSAVPGLNRDAAYAQTFVCPRTELLSSFEEVADVLFCKIKNNAEQIRTLSATRDALLPKLMNGEIEV